MVSNKILCSRNQVTNQWQLLRLRGTVSVSPLAIIKKGEKRRKVVDPVEQTLVKAEEHEELDKEERGGREEEQRDSDNDNNGDLSQQEVETMARAWVFSFPEAKAVSMADVEAWADSNLASLPEGVRSMPRSEFCQRLISIQNMRLPCQGKEGGKVDIPHVKFQRTDQWRPVYSWLESIDEDEVVKSKDISDWLNENPKVRERLYSRHSRYHLMHYIRKCHMKILKRIEKKGLLLTDRPISLKVNKDVVMKQLASVPYNSLNSIPNDSYVSLGKRKEALQKYEILVQLEKLLLSSLPSVRTTNENF